MRALRGISSRWNRIAAVSRAGRTLAFGPMNPAAQRLAVHAAVGLAIPCANRLQRASVQDPLAPLSGDGVRIAASGSDTGSPAVIQSAASWPMIGESWMP